MDEKHKEDLARILESRRLRKGLLNPYSISGVPPTPSTSMTQTETPKPPTPKPPTPPPPQPKSPFDEKAVQQIDVLVKNQEAMLRNQDAQERRFTQIQEQIQSMAIQSQRNLALERAKRKAEKLEQLMNGLRTKSRPQPPYEPQTYIQKDVPVPVSFMSDGRANPAAVNLRSAVRAAQNVQSSNDVMPLSAVEMPGPVPITARPYSISNIDMQSSLLVLRCGDWWLKWNKKGTDVQPRFMWLDMEKYLLTWGKDRDRATLLCGHVPIESILNVATDQMCEQIDDSARVFYILVLSTIDQRLLFGTEKREKMDVWYTALSNVCAYYAARGKVIQEAHPSTE